MTPTFIKNDEHDEHGYYGRLFYSRDHNTDRDNAWPTLKMGISIRFSIQTPYFEHKLDCETYTRKLAEANGLEYNYTTNIWFHHGYWQR